MLSDVRTFTVRDLDRKPGAVLDACDREGAVQIRRRDGRKYTMRPDPAAVQRVPWGSLVANHRSRIAKIFPESISREVVHRVDQLLAGE